MTRSSALSTRELLAAMVGFQTTSDRSNLDFVEFLERELGRVNVETHRIPGEEEGKANLLARVAPRGATGGGVLFAGHGDVVPVEGQNWTVAPFELSERGGRLYGRGTADMKAFLAAALSSLAATANSPGNVAVSVVLTHDEETRCRGVREVLRYMQDQDLPLPGLCIVGEPTAMAPVRAHKSKQSFHCEVVGHECHSALAPRGVNAVEIAAELVARLRARARRFGEVGPFDRDFDPPHTTLQTGVIRGGTAVNIVPNFCSFDFELRCLPGDDPQAVLSDLRSLVDDQLLPEMRAVSTEAAITIEPISDYAPLSDDGDGTAVERVEALLGARSGKVSFATEAGYYQRAGIPTLVCGPGSIEQAHRPDEYVAVADLERCERFLDASIRRLG